MRKLILKTFLPIGVISFTSELAPYILIPALPQISASLLLSQTQSSALISLYYLMLFLSYGVAGIMSSAMSKKKVLIASSLFMIIGSVIMGASADYSQLIVGRLLQGLGAGFVIVVAQTWISEVSTDKNATQLFSFLTIAMSVAPLVSPIIGGMVSQFYSWKLIFYFLAAITSLSFIAILFSDPPQTQKTTYIAPKTIMKEYVHLLFNTHLIRNLISVITCFFFIGAFMAYSSFLFVDGFKISPTIFGFISVPSVMGIILGQFIVVQIEKRSNTGLNSAYKFATTTIITSFLLFLVLYYTLPQSSPYEYIAMFFVFNIGFGAHHLIAIRRVMVGNQESKNHTSTLINQLSDLSNFISAGIVQLLFVWITAVQTLNVIISITTIVLIFIAYLAKPKS